MDSVKHPRCNFTYLGPTDDIGDLHVERVPKIGGGNVVYSYWRPDAEELALLNAGGTVQLGIWAEPIPPVSVGVEAADGETRRSPNAIDLVVRGRELVLDTYPVPVDTTDLLPMALAAAGWEGGVWEVRDADGELLAPTELLRGRPQPFYLDVPAGADG